MKKNITYSIVVLILLALSSYFYFTNNKSTLRRRDTNFAVKDTSSITKICIQKQGTQLQLEKEDNTWIVNGDFVARRKAMEALFRIIMRLEVMAPVSKSMEESIRNKIVNSNFGISIYAKNKLIKHIKIFEDTINNYSTYMIQEGAKHPYVMQLPGYTSSIASLFIVNEYYWRENIIFHYNVKDILYVSIDYPFDPAGSFIIENTGDDFILKSKYDNESIAHYNKKAILNYLYEYNDIRYDNFLIPNITARQKDSLLSADPRVIITVKDMKNTISTVKGYAIPVENKYDELGNKIEFELDRMYALINNDNNLVVLNYFDVEPFLKKINYFLHE